MHLFDTTSFKKITVHTDTTNGYQLKYRKRMLNHAIGIDKKELYLLSDQQNTYKHLNELKLFKNVNISYEDIGNSKLKLK